MAFIRLLLLVFVTYAAMKTAYGILAFGWIDLRPRALLELLILPAGLSLALWVVYARRLGSDSRSGS